MTDEKKVDLVDFEVAAESLWHSGECRPYKKGDIIKLPATTKVTEESSVRRVAADEPKAKTKAKGDDKDPA